MKRALLIGIDHYDKASDLSGCVNDVLALTPLLARNEDESPNFSCHPRTSSPTNPVGRRHLLEDIEELLDPGADVALLYFAGHGASQPNDVVLVSQDGSGADLGVALSEILGKIQHSQVPRII